MRDKGNFSKKIYIIILFILLFGVLLQISRSQFVLKFQQNQNLVEQRDKILADISHDNIVEKSGENYCILYNSSDEYSAKLKDNAYHSLQYMKKKSNEVDITQEMVNLSNCQVVILATDKLKDIGKAEEIEQFVFEGGHIFFMSVLDIETDYQILYRKFGISSFDSIVDAKGMHLTSNVLIGEKELFIDEDFIHNSAISVDLDVETELLAESANNIPLLWKSEYGKGAFMTFNGEMLQEKINRGFFAGALSLLEPNFIYSIFNLKVFYIDDFPSPIAKGTIPVIYEEYRRDIASFYQEIWWPNMLETSKKHDLRYTGAIIESYNDRVQPPFNNTEDKDSHYLISFGRELIKSGGELGFHGYNHQSLVLDKNVAAEFGYKEWDKKEDMSKSIEELLTYTKDAFPGYTVTSYVPPSNVLSPEGREAMKKAWSDLTVISSLYGEDETGLAYVQEFEIAEDGIIEMPRVTSGYFETEYNRWAEANTMTGVGVFSHFVHPDDVISSDRSNNMSWEENYKLYDKYMSRVHKTYPWVRALPATEASLDMATNLHTQVSWKNNENSIEGKISNYKSKTSYILRSERKIGRLHNCTVKKIDDSTYLVTANDSKFKIELGGN
ncbi:DUF2194 domain-containing protein [Psychrobacillus psychrodurans]|uniref:DUF2194 domain-containing protein n=1 Tax=Psychrobacillus psychrodurans TaxID=126157 RepID=UPI001F4DA9A2|nr:DUF2194 domain-containing protein [Psychrobacillus psychrodurans]MCK1996398.1 DUF2194 domain-containing protein [Psychrobacillus psychrodurans]